MGLVLGQIPVGRGHEQLKERLVALSGTQTHGCGQIGRFTTAQGHPHEVVEAAALESCFKGQLTHNHILDKRNLPVYCVGPAGQRSLGLRQHIVGIGVAVTTTTTVNALGVVPSEHGLGKAKQRTGNLTLHRVYIIVDGLGVQPILQYGHGRLRIARTVECLGKMKVNYRATIGGNTIVVELAQYLNVGGVT